MRVSCILISITLWLSGCVKDKPEPSGPQAQLSNEKKVFILNEGNFGSGNSSISLYDRKSGSVVEDIYKVQNGNNPGDVLQSMTKIGLFYYLVVNSSGRIVICDDELNRLGEIKGIQSPRYIIGVTMKKAYVSDLSSNYLHVFDLNSNTEIGEIPCSGWTEQMVKIHNKVFVTNMRSDFLYVINTITDQITDSIKVGINAGSLVVDKNDKLWVLAGGDAAKNMVAALVKIDPISHEVENRQEIPGGGSPYNLQIDSRGDVMYFLNGDLYRATVSTSGPSLISTFIHKQNRTYYGFGLDLLRGHIYVADALDFSQRSNIYIFDAAGTQETFFKAGINANGFYFE